jgi:hypothetical protein
MRRACLDHGRVRAEKIVGQHDLSYRQFFSHRRMIQDLLREIVGERWVERIDFDSGERVDASFVSPKHENRESDVIWKFRRKDGGEPVFVYILLEFPIAAGFRDLATEGHPAALPTVPRGSLRHAHSGGA